MPTTYIDFTTETMQQPYSVSACPYCGVKPDGIEYRIEDVQDIGISHSVIFSASYPIMLHPCGHRVKRVDVTNDRVMLTTRVSFSTGGETRLPYDPANPYSPAKDLEYDYEKCPVCGQPSVGPCPAHI